MKKNALNLSSLKRSYPSSNIVLYGQRNLLHQIRPRAWIPNLMTQSADEFLGLLTPRPRSSRCSVSKFCFERSLIKCLESNRKYSSVPKSSVQRTRLKNRSWINSIDRKMAGVFLYLRPLPDTGLTTINHPRPTLRLTLSSRQYLFYRTPDTLHHLHH